MPHRYYEKYYKKFNEILRNYGDYTGGVVTLIGCLKSLAQ